jgi:hypothetical protein
MSSFLFPAGRFRSGMGLSTDGEESFVVETVSRARGVDAD